MNQPLLPLRAVIVDGSQETGQRLRYHLENCSYRLAYHHVLESSDISTTLKEQSWDIVLANYDSPGFDWFDLIQLVANHRPDTPVIFVSSTADDSIAAGLMSAGARDFVSDKNLTRLQPVIDREVRELELRKKASAAVVDIGKANRELKETLNVLRKTQEQLIRTERFKALGQMASGVAHDFNNALTRMMGIIEVMTARSTDSIQPLQQLKTTVHEATKIVRRLSAFYKPSEPVGEVEPVNLNDVIKATVALTKPKWKVQSEVSGNPVSVAFSFASVPWVTGQFYELREAFALLIFNACDALPQGGKISVSTRREEENFVVARIEDNGTGMADEVHRRCLERYYTTKGDTRSGLGLALVDELVRRYGGTLEVESEIGKGTAISIRLPVCESPEEIEPVPEAPPPSVPEQLHVLVAEDDLTVSVLLSQFLVLDGHKVDLARSGEEALEKFDPTRHHLVISDRAMPRLNGEQLAKQIKARAPSTPVILSSGYDDANTSQEEKPGGVDYLLPKPITREDLRRAIGAVMQAV